jgi:selenocysteine lyase/cysteine desulfurase
MAARLRELLSERAEVITEADQGTLVTWKAEGDSSEAVSRLSEAGVVVRDLPKLGWLRASCGFWTSDDDLQRLLSAL